MTIAAARGAATSRDFLGLWCGWVLVGGVALAPLLAWLGPLGFAPLVTLMGLLSLPALRLRDEDRPILIVLLGALVWAAVSTTWSPHQPKNPEDGQALKLAAELVVYFSAVCGARRADPALQRKAATVLAFGLALLGLVLAAEAITGGEIYRTLHERFYEPIRPDLARKNIANATFVVAVLAPVVFVGRLKGWRDTALIAPAALGAVLAAWRFGADAPVLAVLLATAVVLAVWSLPKLAPRAMAFLTALLFLAMPLLVWGLRDQPDYAALQNGAPASWGMRLSYWSHALDWIRDQPLRGWGLDASRAMGPGIALHPHNGELQVWLELGIIGAVAAAAFWGLTLLRLSRPTPSLTAAGAAGSAAAYLLFGSINFGIWQEWWLALGAMVAVLTAAVSQPVTSRSST